MEKIIYSTEDVKKTFQVKRSQAEKIVMQARLSNLNFYEKNSVLYSESDATFKDILGVLNLSVDDFEKMIKPSCKKTS